MTRARDIHLRHVLVPILSIILLGTMLATTAFAAAEKSFGATVAPEPLVAGAWYGEGARAASPIVLTLTNTSAQATLGSANVTAPDGIVMTGGTTTTAGTATVVGGVLQLRTLGLAPNTSVVVGIDAQVECAANHASYTWGFVVKQANDFNGVGNDLAQDAPVTNSVTGTCGIEFAKEPAHSEKAPVAITSAIYDPSGDAVTVAVRDAGDVDTVTWWQGSVTLSLADDPSGGVAVLGGTVSGSASNGLVTFAPTISTSATGYSLDATASPTAGTASAGTSTSPVESANFNIVDDAEICESGNSCSATSQGPKTKAVVEASAAGGNAGDLVILSVNDPTIALDCGGYTETSDLIAFDVTDSTGTVGSSDRAKTVTMTLAAQYVTKSASKYEVCWWALASFKTKSGADATAFDGGFAGLLPACANKNPVAPCVASKALDKAKNLVIVVSAPAGDPRSNF
jgi:hypothetical protein